MLQRITDMWPSLLRGAHGGLDEEEQASGVQEDEEGDEDDNIRVDEA